MGRYIADICSATFSYKNFGEYSGCDRTLCNWDAAKEICDFYNKNTALNPSLDDYVWRLPIKEELGIWKSIVDSGPQNDDGTYIGGLNLCDDNSRKSRAQCRYLNNDSCPNAACRPASVWGVWGNIRASYYLGGWEPAGDSIGNGLSVRCILE